jgi:hypothetical protein
VAPDLQQARANLHTLGRHGDLAGARALLVFFYWKIKKAPWPCDILKKNSNLLL